MTNNRTGPRTFATRPLMADATPAQHLEAAGQRMRHALTAAGRIGRGEDVEVNRAYLAMSLRCYWRALRLAGVPA